MYYIMNIGFLPVVGGLVVGEAGGSAVVASVGGWAVEGGAVARRYRRCHFIIKSNICRMKKSPNLIKTS